MYLGKAVESYFEALVQFGSTGTVSEDVDVALQLLEILCVFGSDLRSEFYTGILGSPVRAWSKVIPQLFARICHPNSIVRSLIRLILSRVGIFFPYEIVFPLVVNLKLFSSSAPMWCLYDVPRSNSYLGSVLDHCI